MRLLPVLLLAASVLSLGACEKQPAPAPKPSASATPVPPPSESRDPRIVLVAWAKAVSLKHWDEAYLYWGDHGAKSGMNLAGFKATWGTLGEPQLEIREGRSEGAAGSLFYTAPVTLVDGTRRVEGEVTLRKVNDIPGATPEQLRWHIESTTLKP